MPRISPPTGADSIVELEDDQPYKVSLAKWEYVEGAAGYGGDQRLQIDWKVGDDPDDTVRDWLSLKLGKQQSGVVSKLRMLLNALSQRPPETEIKWFDTDSDSWSYDGDREDNKLSTGYEVVIIGENKMKADGNSRSYRITKYRAPKKQSKALPKSPVSSKRMAATAAAVKDDSEIPF